MSKPEPSLSDIRAELEERVQGRFMLKGFSLLFALTTVVVAILQDYGLAAVIVFTLFAGWLGALYSQWGDAKTLLVILRNIEEQQPGTDTDIPVSH